MRAAQRGDIKHAHKNTSRYFQSKVGIALPDQYRSSKVRTPQYFHGFSKDYDYEFKLKSRSIEIEPPNDEVTRIQFGDSKPVPFVQLCNSKIPELPVKTRTQTSRNIPPRPSTAVNVINYHYKQELDKEGNPGLTMKYFGESGNVIGCFTAAKIPIQRKRPSTATHHRINALSSTPRNEEAYKRFNGLVSLK